MAVVGNRRIRDKVGSRNSSANKGTAVGDDIAITKAQEQLAAVNAKINKRGDKSKYMPFERQKSRIEGKIRDLRGVAKMDLKKRPLKIDNKGLTPNVKTKTPVKVKQSEQFKKAKTETRAENLKRKTGSTYDPTKANRAGQKMGQRKAGGQIKKMAYGGKVKKMMGGGMAMKYGHGGSVAKGKKCPRDGIAMRGKTRA